jgi:hypothetical protein
VEDEDAVVFADDNDDGVIDLVSDGEGDAAPVAAAPVALPGIYCSQGAMRQELIDLAVAQAGPNRRCKRGSMLTCTGTGLATSMKFSGHIRDVESFLKRQLLQDPPTVRGTGKGYFVPQVYSVTVTYDDTPFGGDGEDIMACDVVVAAWQRRLFREATLLKRSSDAHGGTDLPDTHDTGVTLLTAAACHAVAPLSPSTVLDPDRKRFVWTASTGAQRSTELLIFIPEGALTEAEARAVHSAMAASAKPAPVDDIHTLPYFIVEKGTAAVVIPWQVSAEDGSVKAVCP